MTGAVVKTALGNYFDNTRDVTIFAPNNAAFQRIGSAISNMNVDELGRIMKYHVVNGTVAYSSNLPNGTVLKSAQGGSLTITIGGNSLFVNSAKIVQQDLLLSNGVLHIIDKYVYLLTFPFFFFSAIFPFVIYPIPSHFSPSSLLFRCIPVSFSPSLSIHPSIHRFHGPPPPYNRKRGYGLVHPNLPTQQTRHWSQQKPWQKKKLN